MLGRVALGLLLVLATVTQVMARPAQRRHETRGEVSDFGRAGTVALGGELEIMAGSDEEGETEQDELKLTFGPGLAYFVVDGLALLIGPVFTVTKEETESPGDDPTEVTVSAFGGTVGAGYHIPLTDTRNVQVHLIGLVGALTGNVEVESGNDSQEADLSALTFGGQAGVTLAFGGRSGGFLRAGFTVTRTTGDIEPKGGEDVEMKSTDFGLATAFGVYF